MGIIHVGGIGLEQVEMCLSCRKHPPKIECKVSMSQFWRDSHQWGSFISAWKLTVEFNLGFRLLVWCFLRGAIALSVAATSYRRILSSEY